MNKKNKTPTFFISTFFIIVVNFIVKMLGLINKIAITRVLGTSGMSLYVLSFPTIMLFISISGMSLYLTISKLVAESIVNKKYSPKKILKKAILISLIVSFFVSVLYLLILKPLTVYFLKNENLYFPLLTGVLLIPLVGLSDGLKGYFNGIKKTQIASMGNLTEQIGRISFSIIFLYLMIPKGIIVATTFCLLALSFGEICAIIFCLIKIRKNPPPDYPNTDNEVKAILRISVPSTFSRIIGNFTYFLEPILYTTVLTFMGYQVLEIHNEYTIIDAYTIPLLTFCGFIPLAIANTIVPGIASNVAMGKKESVNYFIQKALLFSIIPCLLLLLNLFFFSSEYMMLIYKTTDGANYIKYVAFTFICYYLHIPIVAILQSIGKNKNVFISSTITHFLRLLLIICLGLNKKIGLQSVLIATIIAMIIGFLIDFCQLIKNTTYRPSKKNIINLTLITIFTYSIIWIMHHFSINYFIILITSSIIFIILCISNKLLWIESLFSKIKKIH